MRTRKPVDEPIEMMQAVDVIDVYSELDRCGVTIWIDGGWAVDAAAGRETRPHQDLDIAVEAKQVDLLTRCFERLGYMPIIREGDSRWNFVLADSKNRFVDVHLVVLDEQEGVNGLPVDGIAYPAGSLAGTGVIAGKNVRCVKAEFLLKFKTSYPPRDVDLHDVAVLCDVLGCSVPESHRF